jgi:hypothetical protein
MLIAARFSGSGSGKDLLSCAISLIASGLLPFSSFAIPVAPGDLADSWCRPTRPFAAGLARGSFGAVRAFPAAKIERPLWVSKAVSGSQ